MSSPVSSLQPLPMESRRRRRNAISSSWIYLKKIFTSKSCTASLDAQPAAEEAAATATVCSGRYSMHSVVSAALPETMAVSDSQRKILVVTRLESYISANHQFFPLCKDIFPCPACGEIFRKPHILEQHQTLKHAVSVLIDGDSGNNIVPVVTRLESDISADHQFFPLRNDIFPCLACGEIFQKPHILEQHQTLKHAVSEHIDGDSGNNIVPVVIRLESDISADHQFFPLRNDIFPGPTCLEIFQKPHILEQHQTLKHAVSEHIDGDSGNNIVHDIFKIFKKRLDRHREDTENSPDQENPQQHENIGEIRGVQRARQIKSGVRRRDERCIADGNELLRFH